MPRHPAITPVGVRHAGLGVAFQALALAAAMSAVASAAPPPAAAGPADECASPPARRAALVMELVREGAHGEARAEAWRIMEEFPEFRPPPHVSMALGTFDGLSRAFAAASDPLVFRISGCALSILFERDRGLAEANPDLSWQVGQGAGAWSAEDYADAAGILGLPAPEAGAAPGGGGFGGWLSRRVVGFYRLFVGPAIGSRCALEPSCSGYFAESSRRHGLLGVPMTADRFVREPEASAPDRPLVRNAAGFWRHPDPVSDHDWWFAGGDGLAGGKGRR